MLPCGKYIKDLRIERGMTQKELGLAVGFSEKTAGTRINQYESGERTPRKNTLFAIFDALHIDERELANLIACSFLEDFGKTISDYALSEKARDKTVNVFCKLVSDTKPKQKALISVKNCNSQ